MSLKFQIAIHRYLKDYFSSRIADKIALIQAECRTQTGDDTITIRELQSFDEYDNVGMQYPYAVIYDNTNEFEDVEIRRQDKVYNYSIKFVDMGGGGEERDIQYNLMAYLDAIMLIIEEDNHLGGEFLQIDLVRTSPGVVFKDDADNYLGIAFIDFSIKICR